MLVCVFLGGTAHETAGAPCTRHPRAPFISRVRKLMANLEQSVLRDREPVSRCHCPPCLSTSLRGALATKQSTLACFLAPRWIASSQGLLAMTAVGFGVEPRCHRPT